MRVFDRTTDRRSRRETCSLAASAAGSRAARLGAALVAAALATACQSDRGGTSGAGSAGHANGATTQGAGGPGGTGSGGATAGAGGTGSTGNDGATHDDTTIVAAGVRWIGRVDTAAVGGPRFAWSGTGFAARFAGSSVSVDLDNEDAYYFQAVIDGKQTDRFAVAKGRAVRTVARGLAAGEHTLELYREIEAVYGSSQLLGFTEGTLLAPPPSSGRLIEFVGDSITAGYGNLGNEPHPDYGNPNPCHFSFETESAYMSYGALTARALGADASIIAVSGWGVYRSNAGSAEEVLPKVYDNTVGMEKRPVWDFRTKPQAVVINLGTNDFERGDPGTAYVTALGNFVDTVRSHYPAAWIFCAVGTMFSAAQHAKAMGYVQSVVASRGGDAAKVATVDLGSQDALQGTGCDWHPSVTECRRMADVLAPVIKQKLGW